MRYHRPVLLAAAPLALVALLGAAAPASAGIRLNSLTTNALVPNVLTVNALSSNALAAAGTVLDQLDGVRVEAVLLPAAAP